MTLISKSLIGRHVQLSINGKSIISRGIISNVIEGNEKGAPKIEWKDTKIKNKDQYYLLSKDETITTNGRSIICKTRRYELVIS